MQDEKRKCATVDQCDAGTSVPSLRRMTTCIGCFAEAFNAVLTAQSYVSFATISHVFFFPALSQPDRMRTRHVTGSAAFSAENELG